MTQGRADSREGRRLDEAKPSGPYTLWIDYGYEGWKFTDFPTLREALEAEKFSSSWHISRPAQYEIVEK